MDIKCMGNEGVNEKLMRNEYDMNKELMRNESEMNFE